MGFWTNIFRISEISGHIFPIKWDSGQIFSEFLKFLAIFFHLNGILDKHFQNFWNFWPYFSTSGQLFAEFLKFLAIFFHFWTNIFKDSENSGKKVIMFMRIFIYSLISTYLGFLPSTVLFIAQLINIFSLPS